MPGSTRPARPRHQCAACGYTVRTARKWLETAGAPVCPIAGHGPMQHDPFDPDDETGNS